MTLVVQEDDSRRPVAVSLAQEIRVDGKEAPGHLGAYKALTRQVQNEAALRTRLNDVALPLVLYTRVKIVPIEEDFAAEEAATLPKLTKHEADNVYCLAAREYALLQPVDDQAQSDKKLYELIQALENMQTQKLGFALGAVLVHPGNSAEKVLDVAEKAVQEAHEEMSRCGGRRKTAHTKTILIQD